MAIAELIIKSKPEDDFLEAGCSICPAVKFHLSGNTFEHKQMVRKMFDSHFHRHHATDTSISHGSEDREA